MIVRKGLFWATGFMCVLGISSCSTFKKTNGNQAKNEQPSRQPQFLEGITIRQGSNIQENYKANKSINKNITMSSAILENAQLWQFKYAQLLDVPVETVLNSALYSFIDDWWGTPYRMGGKDKTGIDCSGFANTLLSTVFKETANGTSLELFQKTKRLSAAQRKEGDLVFFKISGKKVSHVGIYLDNDHFVHASTSAGVMISDLNEPYWKKYYAGAGRL
jgi:murein DD-endopeptidase / murein LD-carboxypeptidase